ncbi:MAG: hypothetical protein AAB692_00950 [Patescibacteria group bacterium]
MRQDFEKLFGRLPEIEPPTELLGRIYSRIDREERHRVWKRRIIPGAVGIIASMAAVVSSALAGVREISGQGSQTVFSLVFTDTDMVVRYGLDFLSTVAESLPVADILGVLTASFVALLSGAALADGIASVRDRHAQNSSLI